MFDANGTELATGEIASPPYLSRPVPCYTAACVYRLSAIRFQSGVLTSAR